MEDYSLNFVELTRRHFSGDFLGKVSSLLGETRDKTQAGLNAAIPGLLSGLDDVASTGDGARRLSSAVDDADQSILSDLSRMFGKDSRTSMDRGSGILQSIIGGGGGFSDLVGRIGGSSGLSRSAVTSLLGLLAPIVLGLLKKEKLSRNLDALGIASLLASQRNNIRAAMPDNMLRRAETIREVAGEPYRVPRTTRTETYVDRPEPTTKHSFSWILPLALVAGLVGLMWSLASRPPRTTVHAGRESVRVVPQVTTPSSLERLRMKYQSVINEAQAQGIKISHLYEQNGKLVMKGVAPSSAAVASVRNAITRVDPRQDDITVDFKLAETSSWPAVPESDNRAYSSSGDQTYTVKAGDTLREISNRFYGNPGEYTRIFDANRDQLTNHNRIAVGQELKIPR